MPETVLVTVEQLREVEWKRGMSQRWCPCCENSSGSGHKPHCWLGNAIAQAERLKEFHVGDRVRLRAMPEIKGEITELYSDGVSGFVLHDTNGSEWGAFRYLAELMPEEER